MSIDPTMTKPGDPEQERRALCRFLMADLLEWSAKSASPLVRAEREALSEAYTRLADAVYAASGPKKKMFLQVYPPYGQTMRLNLDIVETAYPSRLSKPEEAPPIGRKTDPVAAAPTPAPKPANDAAAAPAIGDQPRRPGRRYPLVDPRDGRKLA